MTQNLPRLLPAALFAALALTACKRDAEPVVATTPSTLPDAMPPAPAPATPAASAVGTVELGNAIGPDNRVSTAATSFGARDTIYASVAVDGATAGTLGTRWTYQDGQEVHSETKQLTAGGPTTHEFHISKPDGWPLGRYKVEVTLDGNVVQTRDFEVR